MQIAQGHWGSISTPNPRNVYNELYFSQVQASKNKRLLSADFWLFYLKITY